MRRAIIWLTAALLTASPALSAPPSSESMAQARKFGALESISQISMAPDGARVAFVGNHPQGQMVFVVGLASGGLPTAIFTLPYGEGRLSWCRWASSERLVCKIYYVANDTGDVFGFSRMFAINADGSKAVKLTARTAEKAMSQTYFGGEVIDWDVPDAPGSVLMTRYFVPENRIGSNIRNEERGLGVELVDTLSMKRRKVEAQHREAQEYITDGHGTVRIMGTLAITQAGFTQSEMRYFYRMPNSREWRPLSTVNVVDPTKTEFNPYAVDRTRNVAYGLGQHNGTKALYSMSLGDVPRKELLLSRSDVDIDSMIRIGREGRVVGASYATERRVSEFFDPELRKLSADLSKALPGKPAVTFVDSSQDESKLLLLASSDTNPGMFYVYDKKSRQLGELLPVRSELQGSALATVKPVTYPAADGTQVPAYLTLPPGSTGKGLPAIVMPHGGPGSRDEWGFDWLAQYFAARGFAVIQPNFRGSSGYGAAWYQKNGFQSWRVAIGDVNDAGRWLVSQGIANPAKLGIVGWSYGGYAALQSSVLDPGLFKAIVAIAPVTDLEKLRSQYSGYTSYPIIDKFIGRGPHIREGSPAQNAEAIRAPVLLFHGSLDGNVKIDHSQLMNDRLRGASKQVTLVEFPGLSHGLNDAAARTRLLSQSDAFLRTAFAMEP
jgi:dipeptidyl aminopeptidase/acylaminoacyl peptidase